MDNQPDHLAAAIAHVKAAIQAGEELTFRQLGALEQLGTLVALATDKATYDGVAAGMGREVGSAQPADYLVKEVGLSLKEARTRIKRSIAEHEPLPEEEAAVRATRQARELELLPPREKLDAVYYAASSLRPRLHQEELRLAATAEMSRRGCTDLRDWVRERAGSRGTRKRGSMRMHTAAGGDVATLYLTDADSALVQSLIAQAYQPKDDNDDRDFGERCYDLVMKALRGQAGANPDGLASLVVSMSLKDIADFDTLPPDTTFPTNTDAELTAAQILELGLTEAGFAVLHDPETGAAINGARILRTASFAHRLMLFAEKRVCSHPDCDAPASRCQRHHIQAWRFGGETVIENLDQVCPRHHAQNDDTRTHKNGKSYFDTDPVTGRKGLRRPDGTIEFNDTVRQEKSAGAKIRNQPWPERARTPGA